MADRMLAAVKRDEDHADVSLRPQTLAEFIGQAKIRSNLKVFIDAARSRR
jgi:Holliday junction DNA helicase RuvB